MTGKFHRVVLGSLAAALGLLVGLACLAEPGSPISAEDDEDSPLAAIDPRQAVVLLADDSRLRVLLADEPIVMQTAHGKLSVPAGDVRRIEFALRLTEE